MSFDDTYNNINTNNTSDNEEYYFDDDDDDVEKQQNGVIDNINNNDDNNNINNNVNTENEVSPPASKKPRFAEDESDTISDEITETNFINESDEIKQDGSLKLSPEPVCEHTNPNEECPFCKCPMNLTTAAQVNLLQLHLFNIINTPFFSPRT